MALRRLFILVIICLIAFIMSCSARDTKPAQHLPDNGEEKSKAMALPEEKRKGRSESAEKEFPGRGRDDSFVIDLLKTLKELETGGESGQRKDIIVFPKGYEERARQQREIRPAADGETVEVSLEFEDADFKEVAKVILGDILKVNYTIAPEVKGKVTINFSGKLKRSAYLTIFSSICDIYNWALVTDGEIYKILPRKNMPKMPGPVGIRRDHAVSDKGYVTRIVPLKYANPEKAVAFLRHFARKGSLIIAPSDADVLIIVDTAESVERYLEVIETFDVPFFAGKGIKFYDIKKLDAKTLAAELEKVVFALGGSLKGGEAQLTFIPIQEANKVLVVTDTPEIFPQVDIIINNIDMVDEKGGTRIFIRKLQNVKAKDVLKVLNQMFREKISDKKRLDRIEVVSEESTNSLVIRAIPEDYLKMKGLIEDLDATPLQVLIKILIAEVSLGDSLQYGMEWWAKSEAGSSILELTGVFSPSTPVIGGFNAYFVNNDFFSFVKLVSSKTEMNVLAAPHILVRDGRQATIEIGADIPILKAEVTAEETTKIKQSIDYESTGIKMVVTPTISTGKYVTLDIRQDVTQAQPNTTSGIDSPEISKRVAETSLVIGDGKTILLGGIIQNRKQKQVQGIPCLMNWPLLGYLFRYDDRTISKTELMIAITVNIIRDQTQAVALTRSFERSLKAIQRMKEEQ